MIPPMSPSGGSSNPAPNPSFAALVRRRRIRRILFYSMIGFALVCIADRAGFFHRTLCIAWLGIRGFQGDDYANFDGKRGTVRDVIDGETLQIRVGPDALIVIKVLGILAPVSGEYWNEQSFDAVREICAGRKVTIRLDGTQTRDAQDRLLANIYLPDDTLLAAQLARSGDVRADHSGACEMQAIIQSAESTAKHGHRGIWSEKSN